MDKYSDEDLLMLSGIQHIVFCERQWALIHLEQQWAENVLTIEGQLLHERADDPFEDEKKGDAIIWRALQLVSYNLGLTGKTDVVELVKAPGTDADSIEIKGKKGRWKLIPVEYKHGKPKSDHCDEVQLCAQAMCLEEMHKTNIREGFIYYEAIRHRTRVDFSQTLRKQVEFFAKRMHDIYETGITPPSDFKPHCRSCSLKDLCLPNSMTDKFSVNEYLKNALDYNF